MLAGDSDINRALESLSAEDLQLANRRLEETQQYSGLEFAFVMDTNGETIASSNWADQVSFVGINYAFRPYFTSAVTGLQATFFAVGATTGITGYFIAEPIGNRFEIKGVVVVKVSLERVVDAWSQLPYDSLISDEFGTVILSTREELLYTPTQELNAQQLEQLDEERRYALSPQVLYPLSNDNNEWQIVLEGDNENVILSTQLLKTESWSLTSVISSQALFVRSAMLFLAVSAVLLIGYLFFRLYQQQRRLINMERRNASELEEQVQLRTGELAAAQKQLIAESNFAMLGRLSAAINHEINQPLASLRLNHASLRALVGKSDSDVSEIQQIVIDNDRTVKRIGRVVNSLRSVARNNTASFDRCSVAAILFDVRQILQRERQLMSQRIQWEETSHDAIVNADEVLLQQALLNLLYNAFDAVMSEAEPRIQVRWSIIATTQANEESRVVIHVDDNGAGVPASMVDTLFEPFTTGGLKGEGLGLGLTLTRQIAEDHHGQLSYENLPGGSRFLLDLPLVSVVDADDLLINQM